MGVLNMGEDNTNTNNGVISKLMHVGFINGDPVNIHHDPPLVEDTAKSRKRKISKIIERETSLRGYSNKTTEAYLFYNHKFIDYVKKSPRDVNKKDIENFTLYLRSKGYSPNSINLAISALSFYYKELYKRRFLFKRQKIEKRNPTILTFDEIRKMLSSTDNPKHKLIIELLYSSGLRVGELVKLRIRDILTDERVISIKFGKGKKDRVTILSRISSENLKAYTAGRLPEDHLFKGRKGHLSIRSVQEAVYKAAKKAGIKKRVYPHALRHSFATHLKDRGIPLEAIRRLLGHESISTTLIYARLSQEYLKSIKSPLDYNAVIDEPEREAISY